MQRTLVGRMALFFAAAWATHTPAAEAAPLALFNGRNLTGWKIKGDDASKSHWTVGKATVNSTDDGQLTVHETTSDGELVNASGRGVDIYSEAEFGDCRLTVEVMVPKGSNSGIYLMGNYEIQILDSYGKEKIGPGDIGAIYGAAVARTNAARPPGEWQKFEIDFQAPRFENGSKIANARFLRVVLNGKVIHEDVEVRRVTGGNLGRGEAAKGPLIFQGDHGPVAYRNIRLTPSSPR